PERLGTPPKKLLSGVPAHVDGLMLDVAAEAGGNLINGDRMWHYTEGIENWNPIWARHGIRILPGPSSIWLDATGNRLPVPLFPGFDTLGTLEHIMRTGHEHTWFVLNQRIIGKEFTLSGSEQNPDLTGRSVRGVLQRARADVPAPVKAFMDQGADFVVERELPALVRGMNALTDEPLIDEAALHRTLTARDREITNPFTKDSQITAIRGARSYLGDRLIRAAAPHAILDPAAGPLVAVRLNILTRKSLGGLQTDLSSRVLTASGEPLPGVYAAGEAAGFGGGGVHGYRSLEGTFLGGCLFSGRTAGRAAAEATA
ncbi:FAD-binding dehydrogenase, partial [Streptomyces wadayamensis]